MRSLLNHFPHEFTFQLGNRRIARCEHRRAYSRAAWLALDQARRMARWLNR